MHFCKCIYIKVLKIYSYFNHRQIVTPILSGRRLDKSLQPLNISVKTCLDTPKQILLASLPTAMAIAGNCHLSSLRCCRCETDYYVAWSKDRPTHVRLMSYLPCNQRWIQNRCTHQQLSFLHLWKIRSSPSRFCS